ncbi:MAG: ABC transporter ATP-binding protein [Nitriliruptorales bacterium]
MRHISSDEVDIRDDAPVDPLLRIEGLRTGFGGNLVLHGVDLEVQRGEVAALLGLNGAGKSVTMKAIGGIVPAWSGSVAFDGEDVTQRPVEARVERGMAHVPQGRQIFPELTVAENLRLGGYTVRRRDRETYEGTLAGLYNRFPLLAWRRDQPAGTLSGGEQAMLAVARALVSQPKLLLIDEPSAGLAPRVVEEVFDLLRGLKRSGFTVLLVEQNVPFALELADRVHVMQRGRIVHESPIEALDREALVAHLGIGRLLSDAV